MTAPERDEADVASPESLIAEALADCPDLHTVIVYGSAVSGNLRDGELASDVDIAVAGPQPLTLRRRLDLGSRLGAKLGREVDLVDLRRAEGLLLVEILTKGRAVRKEDTTFVAEKAIEMYDYQLFFEPIIRQARRYRIARLTGEPHGSGAG